MIISDLQTRAVAAVNPPHRCLILANSKAGGISHREYLPEWLRRCLEALNRRRPGAAVACEAPQTLIMLAEAAAKAGLQANVEAAPPPDQLQERIHAAQSEGFDTIVAAGGDGTIHSVAQALVG